MWTGALTHGLPPGLAGSGRREHSVSLDTPVMLASTPPASAGNDPLRPDSETDHSIYYLYFFIGAVLLGVVAVAVAFLRM